MDKKHKIELLAIDMDGTACKAHGETIEENIIPILTVQKMGVKVIFVTGRPLYNVLPEALKYRMDKYGQYLIAYNGASIWDLAKNKEWKATYLSAKLVSKICEIANKYGIGVWCYTSDAQKVITNFASKDFEEAQFLQEGVIVDEKSANENFDFPAYKLIIINDKPEDEGHQLISQLCKKNNLNTARGTTAVYEINAANINKGIALEKLAKNLKIKPEHIMAIGDGENDIPMFKYVGISVAMGNAKNNVKAFVDEVTDTNVNGGVAKVIKKFFLTK